MGEVVEFKRRDKQKDQESYLSRREMFVVSCPECGSNKFRLGKIDDELLVQCSGCDMLVTDDCVEWLFDGLEI